MKKMQITSQEPIAVDRPSSDPQPASASRIADGERRPDVGQCVLRVEGLVKRFHRGIPPRRRTVEVLNGASLMVCSGELVGLVGENGSGKSTLMQIVVGMLGRDAGEVRRLGQTAPWTRELWSDERAGGADGGMPTGTPSRVR